MNKLNSFSPQDSFAENSESRDAEEEFQNALKAFLIHTTEENENNFQPFLEKNIPIIEDKLSRQMKKHGAFKLFFIIKVPFQNAFSAHKNEI